MKNNLALAALAAGICLSSAALAVDGVSLELGAGDNSTEMWRVGAQWKWQKKWFTQGDWHLGGYWDLTLGTWDNPAGTIVDIGLTPTFRFERKDARGLYLEGAIGFHYLSKKPTRNGTQFSTNFNFGDHVGAGVRFGDRGRYDLGLRLQHLSNAGIDKPNPGINFAQLRFQYHFD